MAFDFSSEAVAFIAVVALTISLAVLVRSLWPQTDQARNTVVVLAAFAAIASFFLAVFQLLVA